MATFLATWGAPGPQVFRAPVIPSPPIVPVVTGISDGAFRRKRKKRRLELIAQPTEPVSVAAPIEPIALPDNAPDFRTLAEISGTSIDAFRAEVDRDLATIMHRIQEEDDEEALTVILTALED